MLCEWTGGDLKRLRDEFRAEIPARWWRDRALARIEGSLDPASPPEHAAEWEAAWAELARQPDDEAKRAEIWEGIGCDKDGAPWVLNQLASRLGEFGPENGAAVAKSFLRPAGCDGAKDMSAETRARLETAAGVARR